MAFTLTCTGYQTESGAMIPFSGTLKKFKFARRARSSMVTDEFNHLVCKGAAPVELHDSRTRQL